MDMFPDYSELDIKNYIYFKFWKCVACNYKCTIETDPCGVCGCDKNKMSLYDVARKKPHSIKALKEHYKNNIYQKNNNFTEEFIIYLKKYYSDYFVL